MKRILGFIASVLILTSLFSVLTYAQSTQSESLNPEIVPMWTNTATVTGVLSFANVTSGYAEAHVNGKIGVTRIEGEVTVYKLVGSSWIYVTSDSTYKDSRSYSISVPFQGEIGFEYRADFKFTVYKDGFGEVIERTAYKTCG